MVSSFNRVDRNQIEAKVRQNRGKIEMKKVNHQAAVVAEANETKVVTEAK